MATTQIHCRLGSYCFVLWLALLAVGCTVRSGQSTTRLFQHGRLRSVSGYALDATSRQPMAGVPIAKNDAQTITGKDGFFRLKYRAAETGQYRRDGLEELRVSLLNYAGSAAIPADTTQRVTLLLVRNSYRFPPRGSLHPADSVHVSAFVLPWSGEPGSQKAFLIQDSTCRQPRKLRTLTFRFGKEGFAREPFRVRIYQYNRPAMAPGDDLLTENYIVIAPSEGVFTYDLSGYDVTLSGSGFFLALEYVAGSDKFYWYEPVVGYSPIGPILHPPYTFADIRTWTYTIGKGWSRATAVENCWPLYESALSVEVEAVPNAPAGR